MADKEKAKGPKDVIYILVPKLNKPVFKGGIMVSQDHAVIENGQTIKSESTDRLDPDGFGIYSWRDDHENHERRVRAMEAFMAKKNIGDDKFIIGPFESREKACKEMHKVRPKSDAEQLATIKAESAEKDAEIEALKAQIQAAKSAGKKPSSPDA